MIAADQPAAKLAEAEASATAPARIIGNTCLNCKETFRADVLGPHIVQVHDGRVAGDPPVPKHTWTTTWQRLCVTCAVLACILAGASLAVSLTHACPPGPRGTQGPAGATGPAGLDGTNGTTPYDPYGDECSVTNVPVDWITGHPLQTVYYPCTNQRP